MSKQVKKRRKRRAPLTPEQRRAKRDERQFKADIRTTFVNCGFTQIPTRDQQFEVQGRRGEIDAIFCYKNIIVVVEDTQTASSRELQDHLRKKVEFYQHLKENEQEFWETLQGTFSAFKSYFKANPEYEWNDYRFVFVYCSRFGIDRDHRDRYVDDCLFLEYPYLQYFLKLAKTIHGSARFELFKFLGVELADIGVANSARNSTSYEGLLLPESPSGFPTGHKLVSFLVDPQMLLEQAFVLRADGWRDTECLYQRLLIKGKIEEMRRYLASQSRVFVNNVIVTLPSNTALRDSNGRLIGESPRTKIEQVTIDIPREFGQVGIIDGQHRIFCYHEGSDQLERKIGVLRTKQHLLVTGIVYPPSMSVEKRQKFEANLFLEINDKQKRVKSDLKQSIEMIVEPRSNVAIAKSVIAHLDQNGVLKGIFEIHFYDKQKLKTASIVSYGLKYIVDIKSANEHTFYKRWRGANKTSIGTDRDVLSAYVRHCASEINVFFSAFRDRLGVLWTTDRKISRAVNTTTFNGLIYCLRLLLQADKLGDFDSYRKAFTQLEVEFTPSEFDFKSSHWRDLGERIYRECFGELDENGVPLG